MCRHSQVALYPGKKNPGPHGIRDFVGHRAGLDVLGTEKYLAGIRTPGRPAQSLPIKIMEIKLGFK
jgi:hypothetical protein